MDFFKSSTIISLFSKNFPNSVISNLLKGYFVITVSQNLFYLILIITIILSIFILNPLRIGLYKFFIRAFEDDVEFKYLFSPFLDGSWFKISIKMLIRDIYLFLWFLLLFIPGIVKTYEYFYVDYILAENPNISISDAIALSKQMTSNEKFDIFILGLSFIGWEILMPFTLYLGYLILTPYIIATYTSLYILKRNFLNEYKIDENRIGEII